MKNPPLILADEPTAALDPENSEEVMNLLVGLKDENRIIIIATHNPLVWNKADEIIDMRELAHVVKKSGIRRVSDYPSARRWFRRYPHHGKYDQSSPFGSNPSKWIFCLILLALKGQRQKALSFEKFTSNG